MVNRHEVQPIVTCVTVSGAKLQLEARVFEINGASPDAENSVADPHKVEIQQKRTAIAAEKFNCEFPPHSVTLLRFLLG